jgi:hypothetical protein
MLIWVEHIGYIVKFPGCDKDMRMALDISFPRSAPSKRRYHSEPLATQRSTHPSQAETIPLRGAESRQPIDESEWNQWGSLISQTIGRPDIRLFRNSTGLGKQFQFVDMHTGERQWDFSISFFSRSLTDLDCRVFPLQTGEFGIRAIKPIIVDGKCIENRKTVILKPQSQVVLCEDDMFVTAVYEVQFNT